MGMMHLMEPLQGAPDALMVCDNLVKIYKVDDIEVVALHGLDLEVRYGEMVALVGASGSGKTHLATALATEACGRGRRVRFFRVTELATLLLEAREERALGRLRSQLARLDLLVLDEFGYVPASKVGAELLFDVISTAYERSSVIVTTNLPFEEWKEVLGSERLTGATLGGSICKMLGIYPGFKMEFIANGQRLVTSTVQSVSVFRSESPQDYPNDSTTAM